MFTAIQSRQENESHHALYFLFDVPLNAPSTGEARHTITGYLSRRTAIGKGNIERRLLGTINKQGWKPSTVVSGETG
ncbi:hypothetical protein Vi05172_g3531 [Venturia inaequalis]|nr:hypothetical protein Vi05172_g3531 [Venturia inaequalis]